MGLGGEVKGRQECFMFSYWEGGQEGPKLPGHGKGGQGPEAGSACRTEAVFLDGSWMLIYYCRVPAVQPLPARRLRAGSQGGRSFTRRPGDGSRDPARRLDLLQAKAAERRVCTFQSSWATSRTLLAFRHLAGVFGEGRTSPPPKYHHPFQPPSCARAPPECGDLVFPNAIAIQPPAGSPVVT